MKKVLLIIDMQKAFDQLYSNDLVKRIVNTSSNYDIVIATKWINHKESKFIKDLKYNRCLPGSKESELHPEIEKIADFIVESSQYSKLLPETEINSILNTLNDDFVLDICGAEIDACVLATAFSAWDLRYNFHILTHLCTTPLTIDHVNMLQLFSREFGSKVLK